MVRILLAVVILLLIVWIVRPELGQAAAATALWKHLNYICVAGIAACQVIVYVCVGLIFRTSLPRSHSSIPISYLAYCAFAFLFANRVIPGPAFVGLATLIYLLAGKAVSMVNAQAAATSFYVADYASFICWTAVCFAQILVTPGTGALRQATILALLIIVTTVAVVSALYAYRLKVRKGRGSGQSRTGDQPGGRWSSKALGAVERQFHQLEERLSQLALQPIVLRNTLIFGLIIHSAEIGSVYFAELSVRAHGDFAAAAVGYVAGNLAAIVSVLPGGIGLYEASMVSALHLAGHLTVAQATAATLLYRLFSLILPLPALMGLLLQVSRRGMDLKTRLPSG